MRYYRYLHLDRDYYSLHASVAVVVAMSVIETVFDANKTSVTAASGLVSVMLRLTSDFYHFLRRTVTKILALFGDTPSFILTLFSCRTVGILLTTSWSVWSRLKRAY